MRLWDYESHWSYAGNIGGIRSKEERTLFHEESPGRQLKWINHEKLCFLKRFTGILWENRVPVHATPHQPRNTFSDPQCLPTQHGLLISEVNPHTHTTVETAYIEREKITGTAPKDENRKRVGFCRFCVYSFTGVGFCFTFCEWPLYCMDGQTETK